MLHIVGPVFVFFAVFLSGIIWLSVRNGYTGHLGTVLLIALFCTVTLFKRHRTAILEHAESIHPVVYDLPPARIVIPLVLYCAATGFLYAPNDIVLFGHNIGTGMLFFMLHIAIGLGAGILASMIAAGTASIKSTAFALAAVTAFAGGITHSLALSPILVGALTGVFLINSAKQRLQVVEGVFSAHNAVEKIFAFLMGYSIFIQANADLAIAGMAFAGAVLIAVARSLMQYGLASLWIQRFHAYNKGRRLLWAALTGQGTVAAGLAVEYIYRVPDNPGTFILLASIVIVSQISTVFIIRSHY
jgi:hypothetical protein